MLAEMKRGETRSLNGNWMFLYTPDFSDTLPSKKTWNDADKMMVPGYWDDHIDAPKSEGIWKGCTHNPDYRPLVYPMSQGVDATLPYIVGCGWYRCELGRVEADGYTLLIESVMTEVKVWLNGKLLAHQKGYGIPLQVELAPALKQNQNELVIAVSNLWQGWMGCSTRGFKGYSGGITGAVTVHRHAAHYINSFHVFSADNKTAVLKAEIISETEKVQFQWRILKDTKEMPLLYGRGSFVEPSIEIIFATEKLKKWSDIAPELYWVEVSLYQSGELLDMQCRRVGFRKLESRKRRLFLNGAPVYLRGATEHCYFPLTCTPPQEKAVYLENIHKIQRLGFNWLRFHTWLPNEAYLSAADEAGMMIQLEAPKGVSTNCWEKIVTFYRRHPSVVIFCGGNEDLLDEMKIEQMEHVAELVHRKAPDILFSPMEALRGIEYGWEDEDLGTPILQTPFQHNPDRLEKLKSFSDVLEPFAWGNLSYNAGCGDWKEVDMRLSIYERPCLTHEMGIYGGYLDTRLWEHYAGTRIGTSLMQGCRKYLEEKGVLAMADTYYQNSCKRLALLHKHNIEMARKCETLCGYDFLGAIDYHWHRSGYTSGMMNEFYELKPGTSGEEVQRYNAPDVLLLDIGKKRNFFCNELLMCTVYVSVFGEHAIQGGRLTWQLEDEKNAIFGAGIIEDISAPRGEISVLTNWEYRLPELEAPNRMRLSFQLEHTNGTLENEWDIWVFPNRKFETASVTVVDCWSEALWECLHNGGRVLITNAHDFDSLPTTFQPMSAGRTEGQFSDVLHPHSVWEEFPQEGYCDWQFFELLQNGNAVVFENKNIPFAPILEIVSSHKQVVRQAAMFEYRIGNGVLFVCGLNLNKSDPAARWLMRCMIHYLEKEDICPIYSISEEQLQNLFSNGKNEVKHFVSDEAFDIGAQLENIRQNEVIP